MEDVFKLLENNNSFKKTISDLEDLICHLPEFNEYLITICNIDNIDNIDLKISIKNFKKKLDWNVIPVPVQSELLHKLCSDFFSEKPYLKKLFIKRLNNDQ